MAVIVSKIIQVKDEHTKKDKNIEIQFKFLKEWSEDNYKKSLDEFIKFHLNSFSEKEKKEFDDKYGKVFRYYPWFNSKLMNSKEIPSFNEFVATTSKLILEYIIRLFHDFLGQDLVGDEFKIVFYSIDGEKRECIALHNDPVYAEKGLLISKSGFMVIGLSGSFLLYRVFLPFYYTNLLDVSPLVKVLTHEMEHYIHMVQGHLRLQDKSKQVFTRLGWKRTDMLNVVFWDLLDEGLAEFRERRYSDSIDIKDRKALGDFKSNLLKWVKMPGEEEAEEFHDDKIDCGDGKYYWGRVMVFFVILYYVVKRKKQSFFTIYEHKNEINLGSGEIKEKLKEHWGRKEIKVKSIPPETYQDILEEIRAIKKYTEFVRIYEEACDFFDLHEDDRIVSMEFIRSLFKLTRKLYEKRVENVQEEFESAMGFR